MKWCKTRSQCCWINIANCENEKFFSRWENLIKHRASLTIRVTGQHQQWKRFQRSAVVWLGIYEKQARFILNSSFVFHRSLAAGSSLIVEWWWGKRHKKRVGWMHDKHLQSPQVVAWKPEPCCGSKLTDNLCRKALLVNYILSRDSKNSFQPTPARFCCVNLLF